MIEARDVAVEFRGGWRNRRQQRALDGLSLTVEEGDVFALLGPNGSGKSTAIHCFLGLIQPDAGSVRLLGERPRPGAAIFERIAYLPEEPHYHLYLTVEEAVRFYAGLFREPIGEARIAEVIDQVGLGEARRLLLRKCSKGMKQKVGIAACLVKRPDVIVLDEPMRGLDPAAVKFFRDALVEMNRRGTTIVLSSHILAEVEMMCTRAAILRRGRVAVHGPLDKLMRQDVEHYVVALDPFDPLPDFFLPGEPNTEIVTGTVPVARIEELFAAARARGARVHSCTLRRLSLEEAFLSAVDGES